MLAMSLTTQLKHHLGKSATIAPVRSPRWLAEVFALCLGAKVSQRAEGLGLA